MKYFSTTRVNPELSTAACPQLHMGIFDASTHHWPRKAAAWLGEMQAKGLGCSGCHTLQIEASRRAAIFHLLVCEAMNPLPPLPANISDCFGSGCRFGDVVIADCETSPPTIRVHENFWAGPSPERESHSEGLVMPLMDEIIASFGEGELWAS